MNLDHCDHCGQPVFFENTRCVACGHALAFFPDRAEVCSLGETADGLWRHSETGDTAPKFRLCANYRDFNVCNWVVSASDLNPLCLSCRLTRVIPDLAKSGAKEAWRRLETAKRRLVYSLLALRLPLQSKGEDEDRDLAFEFRADPEPGDVGGAPVLTGHDHGGIVINIAEANDAEREKRRLALGEPYRTLLGHFRHEIGHYYWDRLIAESSLLAPFRERFGDESVDYAESLKRYYAEGPVANGARDTSARMRRVLLGKTGPKRGLIYLHMIDLLETAREFGLTLGGVRRRTLAKRSGRRSKTLVIRAISRHRMDSYLSDGYPFILSDPVIDKLRFIHEAIGPPVAAT